MEHLSRGDMFDYLGEHGPMTEDEAAGRSWELVHAVRF